MLDLLNDLLWGKILLVLLVAVGIGENDPALVPADSFTAVAARAGTNGHARIGGDSRAAGHVHGGDEIVDRARETRVRDKTAKRRHRHRQQQGCQADGYH